MPQCAQGLPNNQSKEIEVANEDGERIIMDIEARLEEDAEGTLRTAVAAGIAEQRALVEARLRAGAPPDEYRKLNAIKAGLASASLVLERTWSHYHE